MRNKNLWIILAAVLLVAVVAALAILIQPAPAQLSPDAPALQTATPADPTASPAEPGASEPLAYLLVTVGGVTYQPLGLQAEGEFTITQGDSGISNTIHVTPTSVYMASSTCDNQDCVDQGTVHLETMNERVLGNMIICLPHQLTLELYTAQEMQALIASLETEAAQ